MPLLPPFVGPWNRRHWTMPPPLDPPDPRDQRIAELEAQLAIVKTVAASRADYIIAVEKRIAELEDRLTLLAEDPHRDR